MVGVHDPLKSLVKGISLLGSCFLENLFHKKNQGEPALNEQFHIGQFIH